MKKIFLIFMFIFLISCVSAGYRSGDELTLKVPCYNNGTYCSTSATCNISVLDPSGNSIVSNAIMSNNVSYHNLTLTPAQTIGINGDWKYDVTCCDGGLCDSDSEEFRLTPNGDELTTSWAIFYFVVVLLLISLVIGCTFGFFKLRELWQKNLFFYFVYFSTIVLDYVLYSGAYNYFWTVSFIATFFKWLMIIKLILLFPLLILNFIWIAWLMVTITPIKRMMKRGEVYDRSYSSQIRRDMRKFRRDGGFKE